MKTKAIYVTCLLATALLSLFSCQNKDEAALEELVEVAEAEPGFLNLSASLKKQIQVTTGKKSLEEILEDLRVTLFYNADGLGTIEYNSWSYNDLPNPLALAPNDYSITLVHDLSIESTAGGEQFFSRSGFDNDSYFYNGSLSIVSGETNTLNAVLELADVATTINLSQELLNNFPEVQATANVSFPGIADGLDSFSTIDLTWNTNNEGETAYFGTTYIEPLPEYYLHEPTANLNITIRPDTAIDELTAVTRTYDNVEPNEHYIITVNYSVGTASINVSLGNEVIIEEEIPFPG